VSNYLLRMIGRAAGRSTAGGPRPPRPLRWPEPWGGNQADRRPSATQVPGGDHGARFRSTPPLPTSAPAQRVSAVNATDSPEVLSEPPVTRSEPIAEHNESDPPATAEPDTEIEELALVDNPRPSRARIEHHSTAAGNPPMSGAPRISRASVPRVAEGSARAGLPRLTDTPGPVVEVNIGRVEVKLDVPTPPAPKPVSGPRGFAEFEALRRYSAGPWPSRRR
jgi:hypothetical protein